MVNRLVSVGDDFTLPPAVKAADANLPTRLGATALSATFGNSPDAAVLRRLADVSAADRSLSSSLARVAYEDAPGFSETWANTSAWVSVGLSAAAGTIYSNLAAGDHGAKKAVSGLTGQARIIGELNVVAAGTNTFSFTVVGVNNSGNEDVANLRNAFMLAIGVRETGQPIRYGAAGVLNLSETPLTPGKYFVSIMLTAAENALVLHNEDASVYFRVGISRAEFANASHVAVYNSDSRGATGNTIGPVAVRTGAQIPTSKPRISNEGKRVFRYNVPPTNLRPAVIQIPQNYDSRKPSPVVIYAHGAGDTDEASMKATRPTAIGPVIEALVDAGYIVAASDFGGTANWGNPTAVNAMEELYRHLRDSYNIGPIVLLGHSMGGLVSLSTLARRNVPGIVGFYGIEAVYSLGFMYGNDFGFQTQIKTAYDFTNGNDRLAKTAGYDPATREGWEFRGVPMHLIASNGDTSVPKLEHADKLAASAGVLSKVTVRETTGNHVSAGHFDGAEAVAIINGWTGK